MTKLPNKSKKSKSSSPVKKSKRGAKKLSTGRSSKNPRQKVARAPISSYETWLANQVKERVRHPSETSNKLSKTKMPVSTFDTWLKNQPVVEKQAASPLKAPAATFDAWIARQVAQRQSSEEEGQQSSQERITTADEEPVREEAVPEQ